MGQFNRRLILIIVLTLVLYSRFLPQGWSLGSILFEKTWGTNLNDAGKAVATDSNGNIYVTGSYNVTNLSEKLLLQKYNSSGNLMWTRGWHGNGSDLGWSVAVDNSGNVLAGGETCESGACHPILLKLNSTGYLVWARTWGGSTPLFGIYGVAVDSSGNVYVTGYKTIMGLFSTEIFVFKFNPLGDALWKINWDNGGYPEARGGITVGGGGIYIGGTSHSGGGGPFLLKFNSTGGQVWQKTWLANGSRAFSTVTDSSGNVYVTGETDFGGMGSCSGHSCRQVFMLKFNPSSNLVCQRTWGDTSSDNIGQGIATNSRGNVFVSGYTGGTGTAKNDTFLLKIGSSCNLLWSKTWGSPNDDYSYGVATDSAGAAVMTGSVGESPPYTFKTGNSSLSVPNFPTTNANGTISPESVSVIASNGSLFIPVGSETYAGGSDLFILKYNDGSQLPSIPPFAPLLIAIAIACISGYRRFIARSAPNKPESNA